MKNRAFALAVASVLVGLAGACGQARTASDQGANSSTAVCTTCHGGTSDDTGAPPRDLQGRTATTEVTVGAHSAHVKAGPLSTAFDCNVCHPKPARIDDRGHMDGIRQIVWGGVATSGGAAPSWDRGSATCSNVYCHGATLQGGTNVSPRWTLVDGSQAACGACHGLPPPGHPGLAAGSTLATCSACHPETVKPDGSIDAASGRHVNGAIDGFVGHPLGWLDAASSSFHGLQAASGLTGCQKCHALAPPAAVSAITCAKCHPGAGGGDWTTNCSSCHGSGANAAPPRDLSGNTATTFPGVGAHQSHVLGSHRFAGPLDCTACHPKPATSNSAGHVDGTVQVTGYTGSDADLAASVKDPGWSRGSDSCATSYCHGSAPGLGGGAVPTPSWTRVDGSQAFCGSCHGLPPAGHPLLAPGSDARTCGVCHPGSVKDDGTIDLAGGKHLNGRPDGFAGHPVGWIHGQVAAQEGVATCFRCHAPTAPARVAAITCSMCHDALAGGDWTKSCVGCHGSGTNFAPPKDTHGNTATTAVGVGAHQSHVTGAHGIAQPFDCVFCHQKPSDPFVPGHLDGVVQLTGYTGSDANFVALLPSQGWDDAAATCTNYCHGATLQGGSVPRPRWTQVDGTQGACGSCHGLPGPRHLALAPGSDAATCARCHGSTVRSDGTIDLAGGKHLNGQIDGFAGHVAGWMNATSPDFHGQPANKDNPACFVCHAKSPPASGAAFTCSSCHTAIDSGSWQTSCNGCHGSVTSNAPPRDLLGNTATTFVGVGAHQSHVQGTHGVALPLDCTSCHPKPATTHTAPHLDGTVEVTGYTGTDPSLLAAVTNPGWNRTIPSCATSYCHGATLGGGTSSEPVWTRVDGTQAACGACHGLPPTRHMTLTPPVTAVTCAACHPATVKADGTIDVAGGKHVNGTVETDGFTGHGTGWLVPGDPAFHGQVAIQNGMNTCFGCHSAKEPSTNGIRTCASCHDALAGGVDWTTSCVGCHGSAGSAAPPKDVHGNTATTAVGVGAHRTHVDGATGLAQRYDCSVCHQKPSVVFSPGHLDGTTVVTGYTGTDPALQFLTDPGWNRATATCSTSWCHGGYSGVFTYYKDDGSGGSIQIDVPYAGTPREPTWTVVDGTQAACGSCHGIPPLRGNWHSPTHGGTATACSLCHPGVKADGSGFTDTSRHVNGVVDMTAVFTSRCFNCH